MSDMFKYTLVSVLTLGLFSMPSFAQEAEAQEADADVEEIVITGSRIKRTSNENAPTPMVTLGAEQIELTGSINVYDIMNELPQAGEGTSRGNTNFTVNSSGLQTVNLRGLGSGRTLTLVNGRRWVGGVGSSFVLEKLEQLDPFDDNAVSDMRDEVKRFLMGRRGLSRL